MNTLNGPDWTVRQVVVSGDCEASPGFFCESCETSWRMSGFDCIQGSHASALVRRTCPKCEGLNFVDPENYLDFPKGIKAHCSPNLKVIDLEKPRPKWMPEIAITEIGDD